MPVQEENKLNIQKISEAKNFLYLINHSEFSSKKAFIQALAATNYDIRIMDLYFWMDRHPTVRSFHN